MERESSQTKDRKCLVSLCISIPKSDVFKVIFIFIVNYVI